MFVLLSSFVASLDGFIIGLSLKLSGVKISKQNMVTFLFGNLFIYSFAILAYTFFHFQFITNFVSTILYLILAYFTFAEDEKLNQVNDKTLSFGKWIMLIFTHSLDGTLVSLSFVYDYSSLFLILLFSFMSILILLCGYYFGSLFSIKKRNRYIGALLFILLAILNQFF